MPSRLHARSHAPHLATLVALAASILTLGVVTSSPASAAVDYTGLRINEIQAAGTDYVEVTNISSATIDLSGVRLIDDNDAHPFQDFPSGTSVAPGAFVTIDSTVNGLGNGGDKVRLYPPGTTSPTSGTAIDSYTWTAAAGAGRSFGRCPDGYGAIVVTAADTKGAANNCGTKPLAINEVESNGDPVHGDWIELRNNTTAAIDLTGYSVLDNDDTHTRKPFPSGTMIPAGGYRAITVDSGTPSFGLGAADSARLFDPSGVLLDAYTWATHAAVTYARCPDGAGPFVSTSASTYEAANDCASPVRINEIESSGGTPADWVELYNAAASAVDVSGWVLRDSVDTDSYAIPAGTSIAAGGYLVLDQAQFGFELDDADAVRLYQADGTTPADSYSWTTPATTTYGRCPNGTGAFTTTQQPTKGGLNNCPGDLQTQPWPGGSAISTIDDAGTFGTNLSGLIYQGTGTTTPGTLWAIKNGPSTLYKLAQTDGTWRPAPGDWAAGKSLHYADGTGDPDTEGVTYTGAGPDAGMYASTERNNSNGGVSRPAILEFDPNTPGTTLNAQRDYNLTADLPPLGANLGLEGIAWMPDSYLTAHGLIDDSTGAAYTPSSYPDHGTGIFLVGVEQNGMVYGYALDQSSNTFHRVTSFASGFPAVMELNWDTENQVLRVICDDTCQGRSGTFTVQGGHFTAGTYYDRPAGMPNLNNEGFAVGSRSECVNGLKPTYYADDTGDDNHALRGGTITCTPPPAQQVTFTSTPPASPVVGDTYVATATGGASGLPVKLSVTTPATCSISGSTSGSTVTFDHAGTCTVAADQAGNDDYRAGSATQDVVVGKAAGSVRITSTPPSGPGSPAVGSTYDVTTAAGPSSAPVVLTVAPSSTCSISGSTVTFTHAGPCTVTASQAADVDRTAATDTQSVTVATGPQTVTFTSTPPASPVVGGTYVVTATGGTSGNPVVLSVTTPSTCSISGPTSGSTVTSTHAGTCTVQAAQAGDADHAAATATQSVTVGKAAQTVAFTSTPPSAPVVDDTYAVTTTGGASGNPVVLSTSSRACSVSRATVAFVHPGTCTVQAFQDGNADYLASTATQSVTVGKGAGSVRITSVPAGSSGGSSGGPAIGTTYDVTTVAGPSTAAVTISVVPSPVCSVSAGRVRFLHAGTCTVRATQPGDSDYTDATDTQTIQVARGATTTSARFGPDGLTVTVAAADPSAATPTGSVSVAVGDVIYTSSLDDGAVTFGQVAPAEQHRVDATVTYAGDDDSAGSSTTASRTAPTVTASFSGTPTSSGWYGAPVTVTFTCAAGSAPVGDCPAPVTLGEGRGQSLTRSVTAADGGAATMTTRPVDVDLTDPVVHVGGVRRGVVYRETPPTPRCVGTDALSGIDTCTVTSRRSGLVVRVSVVATDLAGHSSSASTSYRVPAYRVVGAPYGYGTYRLVPGRTYRVLAAVPSARTPKLRGPLHRGDHFTGPGRAMGRVGSVGGGRTEWRGTVRLPSSARAGEKWMLGVLLGRSTTVVPLEAVAAG